MARVIIDLTEVYDEFDGCQDMYQNYTEKSVMGVIQYMHKVNGGKRALRERKVQMMLHIYSAYEQVGWESLGVRGLYYRVVSLHQYPKTEATYQLVQDVCLTMRREGLLSHKLVTDGSRHTYGVDEYDSVGSFIEQMSQAYRLDKWVDSDYAVEVTVEKDAMRSILYPICHKYAINLSPTSGFNSESAWFTLAERFKRSIQQGKTPVLLMMTDLDTAGLVMFRTAGEAMARFGIEHQVIIKRVGLTPEQVDEFNLITRTDKIDPTMRACELDALIPKDARRILHAEVRRYVDHEAFDLLVEQENRERLTIVDMANSLVDSTVK